MKKLLAIPVLIIAVVAFLIISNPVTNTDSGDKIKIAVSIRPLADLVNQVGGEYVETVIMLPDGSSPHTYEPMAADLIRLNNTKIAFMIGQELDDWAITMLESGATEGYQVNDLSEDIELLPSVDADEPGDDPHYWLSYSNAKIMAARIATELAAYDEGNRQYYQDNANNYIIELETARTTAVEKISNLNKKELITFHSAFQYFAQDLGLRVVATIEPFPGSEPSPQYLAEVGQIISQYQVRTLFREPELSDAVVAALANDYDAKIETLNPMGETNSSFIEMMSYNVNTITKALSN